MSIARDVGREIKVQKTVEQTEIAVREEMISVIHKVAESAIEVFTQLYNNRNEALKSDVTIIKDDKYNEIFDNEHKILVSDDRLWEIIDEIRVGQ